MIPLFFSILENVPAFSSYSEIDNVFSRGAGWKRQQREKASERDKEIVAKQVGIKAVQTHVIRTPSERRHRMQHKPVVKKRPDAKKGKRRFGLGLIGRLLDRKLKKNRLPSTVKDQLEQFSDHRLVFIFYRLFIIVIIIIIFIYLNTAPSWMLMPK